MGIIAVIGGTGFNDFDGIQTSDVRSIETQYGVPSAALEFGKLGQQEVVFLARHGKGHKLLPHQINYKANLEALRQVGVDTIVAINAVGGIDSALAPQSIVIPHQLIDYTWGRPSTFADINNVVHIDFTDPYCANTREKLRLAAEAVGIPVTTTGVYGVTQGPRLETAAEVNRLEADGCSIVGMTGMPEAALARELGINYACIALVVNRAAGRSEGPITMAAMELAIANGMTQVRSILAYYLLTSSGNLPG